MIKHMLAPCALLFSLCCAPNAASAAETPSSAIEITRSGSKPSSAGPAQHFSGAVRVDSAFRASAPGRASGGIVSFAPGARSAWHVHPLGQTLIVTSGVGRVQQWQGPVEEIRPGDVVWIPAGVKHWHGASQASAMSHVAVTESLDSASTVWMEQVGDAAPVAPPAAAATSASATPAQRMYGEIAPKLAELTDQVLYGDVWERPALSKRDRSLATVSALVAMNRPDQLRSHLRIARENGVTEAELVETITHLAFYAGWPNAVTAITVAKEVFAKP